MTVNVGAATALVSFGTLVALWMVCNAQLFRRYVPDTQLRITRYAHASLHNVRQPAEKDSSSKAAAWQQKEQTSSQQASATELAKLCGQHGVVACFYLLIADVCPACPACLWVRCRYGTVEAGIRVDTPSRMPGRHLATSTRKVLVWLHLGAINAVAIGEGGR